MYAKSFFQNTATLACLLTTLTPACAQSTAFTYQGRLSDGLNPANGNYDLTFILFATSTGGSPIAGPLTNTPTAVSNGLFVATVDFGNQFPGADRWLELGVRTNGGGSFTPLAPRQPFTSVPYAVRAVSAGTVAATNLSGSLSTARLPPGVPVSDRVTLGFVQPNGNGYESASTTYSRAATFLFRGTIAGGLPTAVSVLLYTTNPSASYVVRIQDVTNNQTIATLGANNVGTLITPDAMSVTSLANLPANQAVFEVQIRTTSVAGRAGILSFQMF